MKTNLAYQLPPLTDAADQPAFAAPKPRVLAVDDTDDNLFVIRGFLGQEFDVYTADNGESALEMLPAVNPALVLLDVMMPGIDGFEVCREIRRRSDMAHTKVVMVSARAQLEDRLAGYEAGADDYLTKPFDEQELLAKVRVYLKLKHAQEVQGLVRGALSVMSHQLRTPLNGILPPLEMLLEDATMTADERREWLQIAHASAARLAVTIEKVLLLSGLRSNESSIELSHIALTDVVERLVRERAICPAARGLEFLVECEPAHIAADAKLLALVVDSILDNAVRMSPPGKEIRVLGRHAGDAQYHLHIEDSGPGIGTEHLTRIFDDFSSESSVHHAEGDGLSMALAKEIMKLHSGRISANNRNEGGAVFTLCLPIESHPNV